MVNFTNLLYASENIKYTQWVKRKRAAREQKGKTGEFSQYVNVNFNDIVFEFFTFK